MESDEVKEHREDIEDLEAERIFERAANIAAGTAVAEDGNESPDPPQAEHHVENNAEFSEAEETGPIPGVNEDTEPGLLSRMGRFSISGTLVRERPEALLAAFRLMDVFVIRCEHMMHSDLLEYVGYSPNFRPAKPTHLPFYDFLFAKDEETGLDSLVSVTEVANR